MNELIKKAVKLLEVKSLISLTVIGALTYGFVKGFVSTELYVPIVMAVVTYFFNRRESGGENT